MSTTASRSHTLKFAKFVEAFTLGAFSDTANSLIFLFQFGHWPFAVAQGTYASKYAGAGYFFGKAFNNRKRVFVCSLGYFRSDVSSHLTKLAHLSCKGK